MDLRIGTAAWALPRDVRDSFPPGASNLARYAARFACAEINSSFHRPHRRSTYARWAESVAEDFRFAVKLPKTITHAARLVDCEPLLARFAEESGGLGSKRGPVLVQLPPKLAFEAEVAERFFAALDAIVGGAVALEPRHPSWFAPEAEALLVARRIARVAADPAPVAEGAAPGGWRGLAYFRLHGSPRVYWSRYEAPALAEWRSRVEATSASECWMIFDNTASGAATADALAFSDPDRFGGARLRSAGG
jgi:uncharacterized protein YecE (DUF72 family)